MRLCPGLKAPGRNYKLLPALLAFSPPDCLRSASRPQCSFGMRENKRLFSHCRDRRPRLSVFFIYHAKKKEEKKSPVTTTAAVSQTPQRFKVGAKFCCVAPVTLFGVCNDLPRRSRNAFFRKFLPTFYKKVWIVIYNIQVEQPTLVL